MMEHLNMQSMDKVAANVAKIRELFPNCVTERINSEGKLEHAIDFDMLKQELSDHVVDGLQERYQFTWPDKRKAILAANAPINKTLRPCREESVDFDNTENLYIEGDNLEVLKLLRETYLRSIDVIYIDPPYNTGNNLIYRNNYYQDAEDYLISSEQLDDYGNHMVYNLLTNGRYHTDWLNMLYSRLKVSKDLLSDRGILVLTIDDNEIETTTMLLNEIFGEENHLATIIIKNNPSGRSTLTGVSIAHEYALFYGANPSVKLGRLPRNDKQIARYKEIDQYGQYEWVNFRKHGGYKEDATTMYYPIFIKNDCSSFRIPKILWNKEISEYELLEEPMVDEIISYPIDENGRARRWKWGIDRAIKNQAEMKANFDKDKNPAIYIKARMKDEGMLPLTVWDNKIYSSTEYGTNLLNEMFDGNKLFDYPKSLYAVMDSIKIASQGNESLILDFFSGSATTAHAVFKLNLENHISSKFILVQIPEKCSQDSAAYKAGYKNICEIGKERIRRAGQKIKEENPLTTQDLDIGFRVLKCDSSNMEDVYFTPKEYMDKQQSLFIDNIKKDRNDEDLLFDAMLKLDTPLSSKIEKISIAGKTVYNVAQGHLMACFDKNVTDEVITAIAKEMPSYFVMRDSSQADDSVAINFEQIFNTYSPQTVRRVL